LRITVNAKGGIKSKTGNISALIISAIEIIGNGFPAVSIVELLKNKLLKGFSGNFDFYNVKNTLNLMQIIGGWDFENDFEKPFSEFSLKNDERFKREIAQAGSLLELIKKCTDIFNRISDALGSKCVSEILDILTSGLIKNKGFCLPLILKSLP
jgi:hypothetical protein